MNVLYRLDFSTSSMTAGSEREFESDNTLNDASLRQAARVIWSILQLMCIENMWDKSIVKYALCNFPYFSCLRQAAMPACTRQWPKQLMSRGAVCHQCCVAAVVTRRIAPPSKCPTLSSIPPTNCTCVKLSPSHSCHKNSFRCVSHCSIYRMNKENVI